MDKEEYIRPPDKVRTERLFDNIINPNWDIDEELNKAIENSKNEFNLMQEKDKKERQYKFKNIKIQLNKIISFDKVNLYYYELILSIIEMYELCIINEYKTNEKEYTIIFKFLQTFRLPSDEIEQLKKIIIC